MDERGIAGEDIKAGTAVYMYEPSGRYYIGETGLNIAGICMEDAKAGQPVTIGFYYEGVTTIKYSAQAGHGYYKVIVHSDQLEEDLNAAYELGYDLKYVVNGVASLYPRYILERNEARYRGK